MECRIPPQATFFYRGKWTQEMDVMLLSTLITLRRGRQWADANVPEKVLRNVCVVLKHLFGVALTTDDVAVRVKMLKARYIRFKKLVKTNGVQWISKERFISAADSTWKLIFQTDALAAAYYYRDEPDFSLLASFFGLDDVKQEFPQEVITISDNTVEVIVLSETDAPGAPIRGHPTSSPNDSDEVTSPNPVPATFAWRKLFDEDVPCFYDLAGPSSPRHFNPAKGIVLSSPKGSSCASWNPMPKSR